MPQHPTETERERSAVAAFVIMETLDDAKWIVQHVHGTLSSLILTLVGVELHGVSEEMCRKTSVAQ